MKRIRKDDELRPEYDFSKLTPAPKNRRPRLSPLVMACLEFKPDAAHINALPDPLRRFIHDIETNADPAGIIRENIRRPERLRRRPHRSSGVWRRRCAFKHAVADGP